MIRRRHVVALFIVAPLLVSLGGCGIGQRIQDWLAKPVEDPIQRREKSVSMQTVEEEEPPPREDFSDYEARPIPSGPGAPTNASWAPVREKWLRRISTDLYREMGMRDPRWDSEAEALLEAYVKIDGCQPDKPTVDEYEKLADAAMDAECPDPLVRMVAGKAFFLAERYEDAYAHIFRQSPPGAPDYPEWATLAEDVVGWQLHCRLHPEEEDFIKGSYQAFKARLGKALRETEFSGKQPRAVFHWLEHRFNRMDEHQFAPMLEALQTLEGREGVDEWLVHTILGCLELKTAFAARGGSFAAEVSERGWEGFNQHLPQARRHLVKAWKLNPDRPEPACMMIQVITGESGCAPAGRAWFDRAVAAEMDHLASYGALMWQQMPRWGGSHEQLLSLAEDCMETKRYDTGVPAMAYTIARTIAVRDGATDSWDTRGSMTGCRRCSEATSPHRIPTSATR